MQTVLFGAIPFGCVPPAGALASEPPTLLVHGDARPLFPPLPAAQLERGRQCTHPTTEHDDLRKCHGRVQRVGARLMSRLMFSLHRTAAGVIVPLSCWTTLSKSNRARFNASALAWSPPAIPPLATLCKAELISSRIFGANVSSSRWFRSASAMSLSHVDVVLARISAS